MRAFLLAPLAAVALMLGSTSSASADWCYRDRVCYENGCRVVVHQRYWVPGWHYRSFRHGRHRVWYNHVGHRHGHR
jgi:hypothetical protein